MTGPAKGTVLKLLADLGWACSDWHDENVHGLTSLRVQADEIWSFVYAKERHLPPELQDAWGYGDVWTWTAVCADSKFMISWLVGGRDTAWATLFMRDVASRLAHRVQLTTDGHKPYLALAAYHVLGARPATSVRAALPAERRCAMVSICYDCAQSTVGRCAAHAAQSLPTPRVLSEHEHAFVFERAVNEVFAGTTVVSADGLMVCRACGAWRIVAQGAP